MKKQRIYTLLGTLSFDLTVALFLRCSVSPFFFYPFFFFSLFSLVVVLCWLLALPVSACLCLAFFFWSVFLIAFIM